VDVSKISFVYAFPRYMILTRFK